MNRVRYLNLCLFVLHPINESMNQSFVDAEQTPAFFFSRCAFCSPKQSTFQSTTIAGRPCCLSTFFFSSRCAVCSPNQSIFVDAGQTPTKHHLNQRRQLDDLVANKKDLDEVLMFKSTHTLQLDDASTASAVSSNKSHKLEVWWWWWWCEGCLIEMLDDGCAGCW